MAKAHGTSTVEEQVHMLHVFKHIFQSLFLMFLAKNRKGITLQVALLIKHVSFIWNATSAEAESLTTFLKHMMQSL